MMWFPQPLPSPYPEATSIAEVPLAEVSPLEARRQERWIQPVLRSPSLPGHYSAISVSLCSLETGEVT